MTSSRTSMKRAVGVPFSWARRLRRVPRRWVLVFHEIGDHSWAIPPDRFLALLDALHQATDIVPLPELLERSAPEGPPRVALTFDDGYVGVARHAIPALARAEIPATVFLPTDLVGETDGTPPPDRGLYDGVPLMGWDTIRAAAAASTVVFESHGASHRSLRTMAADERRRELDRSREAIRSATGRVPRFLAYPYGAADAGAAASAREAGFDAAFTTRHGGIREGADPFLLPRADVRADYEPRDVWSILRGDWDFLSLTQALRGPRA